MLKVSLVTASLEIVTMLISMNDERIKFSIRKID